MDYMMTQYDYEENIIETINKVKEKVKIENDKIKDCNLNVEIYTDYFKFDSDSGYIINNIGEFRDREFYLFFENGNIYFDLSY